MFWTGYVTREHLRETALLDQAQTAWDGKDYQTAADHYEKFLKDGLSEEDFQRSRSFLTKYVNILTQTKSAELGYAIDSDFYGIPQYNDYLKTELAKLTLADVNRVIKQYIHPDHAVIAVVTKNGEDFKKQLLSPEASPMKYNSPKPESITAERLPIWARLPACLYTNGASASPRSRALIALAT